MKKIWWILLVFVLCAVLLVWLNVVYSLGYVVGRMECQP